MCLSKVTATYDKPSGLIVDGWKGFSVRGTAEGLLAAPSGTELVTAPRGVKVQMDAWVKATGADLVADDGKYYQAGFHAYFDEHRRDGRATRRVYLRGITCAGEQDGYPCVIAQEMYVPSDTNAWPPLETTPRVVVPKKRLRDRLRRKKP